MGARLLVRTHCSGQDKGSGMTTVLIGKMRSFNPDFRGV